MRDKGNEIFPGYWAVYGALNHINQIIILQT